MIAIIALLILLFGVIWFQWMQLKALEDQIDRIEELMPDQNVKHENPKWLDDLTIDIMEEIK